jgi:hypothetical protein
MACFHHFAAFHSISAATVGLPVTQPFYLLNLDYSECAPPGGGAPG